MTLFSLGFHMPCFFLGGNQFKLVFCVQQHQLFILDPFVQKRESGNVCVVQQFYSLQFELSCQEKELLVVFYVHQHLC
jgi:hypothetical protein